MPLPLLCSSRDKARLFDKICFTNDSEITRRKWTQGIMWHKTPWYSGWNFSCKPADPASSWLLFCILMMGIISELAKQSICPVPLTPQISTQTVRARFSSYVHAPFLLPVGAPISSSNNWCWKWPLPSEENRSTSGLWSCRLQHCHKTKIRYSDPDVHKEYTSHLWPAPPPLP